MCGQWGVLQTGHVVGDAELCLSGTTVLSAGWRWQLQALWAAECVYRSRWRGGRRTRQLCAAHHGVQLHSHALGPVALFVCTVGWIVVHATAAAGAAASGEVDDAVTPHTDLLREFDAQRDTALAQAISAAKTAWEARKMAGVDQGALGEAARIGFALGEFEESDEDGAAVVEEFYPADGKAQDAGGYGRDAGGKQELAEKLRQKAGRNPSPIMDNAT